VEGVKLRPLRAADREAVLAIQQASPEAAQWRSEDYARVFSGEMAGWAAEDAAGVEGFLVARHAADECEIMNLAVAPGARRRGTGSRLLAHALEAARARGARRVFLEVRASNLVALGFYARHGFANAGRRRNYYAGPCEDALVLARTLD
jgi:[ribosomal protein S18]-alanine N-acetyltransferase